MKVRAVMQAISCPSYATNEILDYGCALQREILIQGRLYISENHVCFHANIFGWITDVSVLRPFSFGDLPSSLSAF